MRVLGVAGLNQLEQTHRSLMEAGAGALGGQTRGPVEVVIGADQVRHGFRRLRLAASQEVCALVPDAPAAGRRAENRPWAGDGPALRVVVAREVLVVPGALGEVRAGLGPGAHVRVAERVPARLLVADRSLAMVPLLEDAAEPSALLVRAGGLLESLVSLFESVWARSQPLQGTDGGTRQPPALESTRGPDAVDLRILSLLLAGGTDTAVAKQLDLGLRTVQRRVKRLMELAGVTTRLQLGWHAHERGWVARRGPGAGWDTDPQQ
jgi:hypothetical protein